MNNLPYDDSSIQDIFRYSNKLIGKRFVDVLTESFNDNIVAEDIEPYDNARRKGSLGNLLEEHYFLYKPNSDSVPDFEKVGMELKVTPYEHKKKGIKAGERLVITMIPNDRPIDKNFKGSHLESKIKLILMIWYLRDRSLPRTDYRIDYVNIYDLYSETLEKDLDIILEDYKTIVDKVISGNAHTLSEGDTKYLGACTKGSTAKKSLQSQYYNTEVPAKRRAFSLKQSYMSYILNNYVNPGKMSYDSIFGKEELDNENFDSLVLSKINKYIGYSVNELCKKFNIPTDKPSKRINKTLVNRILGVCTDNSEEFEKANIVIKTIRIEKNGKPRESMSFPKFNIMELIDTDFEDSYEYDFFEQTRFLFVVFKQNSTYEYELSGAKFWNMPIQELETIGKQEWNMYKNKFIEGINFKLHKQKDGKIVIKNDLPKKTDTKIFHVRPHASKSAYIINGKKFGNGSESDMDLLPNGDKMTNQCFWLNNDYISEIIKEI